MPEFKPFKRTARNFADQSYQNGGKGKYIRCSSFAQDGRRYIRSAVMLQGDLLRLFEFIEPAEDNFDCYSFRIHELLIRCCIEIESNFKAVLKENGYNKSGRWDIRDYKRIEGTHFLSQYEIKVPDFVDQSYVFRPFFDWTLDGNPPWHRAYNLTKHDRHNEFKQAKLGNMLNAMCGLFVVLASQFHTEDLSGGPDLLSIGEGVDDGFETVAGGLFRVKFPILTDPTLVYDFEHSVISDDPSFFNSHNYN